MKGICYHCNRKSDRLYYAIDLIDESPTWVCDPCEHHLAVARSSSRDATIRAAREAETTKRR